MSLVKVLVRRVTDEEKKAKIFAMQSPSTQAAMRAHEQGKKAHDGEWPPKGWLAVADAKNMDEAVAARPLTYHEAKMETDLRQNRGAHLAEMFKDKEASGVTEQKRNWAINAFMMTPVKFKDLMKQAGLATVSLIDRVKAEVFGNEN